MPHSTTISRFDIRRPAVQVALRGAVALAAVVLIAIAAFAHRTIAQRDVAAFVQAEGCEVGYTPAIGASHDEAPSTLAFHARHRLVFVAIHSLHKPEELVEQLCRIDTLQEIRIEYAGAGGCAFAVAPELVAIRTLKARFPHAVVRVKFTFIPVVG